MSALSGKWMNVRLHLVAMVFVLVFAAVIYKSYDLMVVQSAALMTKANKEIERHLNLGAVRGEIFDATGERLAAAVVAPTLYADPSVITGKDDLAETLAGILNLNKESVTEDLAKKTKYVELKRHLNNDEVRAVEELQLHGLGFAKDYRRDYPNGTLASHLLGFVGRYGEGLEGLERALEDKLKAGQDKMKVKRDNLGRIMVDSVEGDIEQTRGNSVVLTIDRRIQYITEKALATAVNTYRAESGMALVMNPRTGAVLASAVLPTFDPNRPNNVADEEFRRNRILTDPFEPGSTFKVFVVAAALEEGLVTPNTIINCENGAFRVANHTVRDTSSHGDLTISEIIKKSSNIGSLKLGGILGNDLLYNYLTRFSFGERTGLAHLAGENSGKLRKPGNWHQLDAANIAFGQGVSVTALQMVMAMSSLANDGVLMMPYMVDRVLDADGRILEKYEPQILRQVVSPLTARQVGAMLRMAVQKGGTGSRADVQGYPVAGKTGTAQKVGKGSKGYTAGKYVSSFLGFAPYHDPQICVMVVLDEPKNGYYGGSVAGPAFKEIVENALPLLDVPPTEGNEDPVWPMVVKNGGGAPGLIEGDRPSNFIRVKLRRNDKGSKGPITFASLSADEARRGGAIEPVFTEDVSPALATHPGVMPDLAGLSMRQVLEVMSDYALDLEYFGSGLAVKQEPTPGTNVAEGQAAAVYFAR